ncbi:MAG: hypothetical protein WA824_02430 [Candidatus Sulfotelmatobacter sp.]
MVDEPVGVQCMLVIAAGAIGRWASIERFAHALGGGKMFARPGIGMAHTRISPRLRHCAEDGEDQQR